MKVVKWCWHKIKGLCSWYVHLFKGRRWYVKLLSGFISFVLFLIVYFGMVDINFLGLFGKSPGFYEILHPPSNSASEVYSADGKSIGKFYNENRSPVKYEDVAPVFWDALIDTEDERFYHHHGVDFSGVLGAVKDAIVHQDARGASTITQQLAKNMFRMRTQTSNGLLSDIPGLRMLIVKTKEWIIATKIEMVYDKKDILTMYANTVDFGSNAFGIKTASKNYFNITPAELTTDQAAVLVGILKATSYYNPLLNPENSKSRRNVVMKLMVKNGHLSEEEYQRLSAKPVVLSYSSDTGTQKQTTYFKDAVEAYLAKWCHDTGYDLYTSGLKIYTTLDTRLQAYAENAVESQMKAQQKAFAADWGSDDPWRDEKGNVIPDFVEKTVKKLPVYEDLKRRYNNTDSINHYLNLPHQVKLWSPEKGEFETEMSTLDSLKYMMRYLHCGFVAMEPQTGAVVAWVGDIDYNVWKYDKVTAMHQPGSTFKLFVYTEAFNQGLTPCDKRRDEPVSVPIYDEKTGEETVWKPTNASKYFSGDSLLLMQAFARSTNSVAVRLGIEMGVKNVIKTAHDMGIKSQLDPHPSTLLGASDVNLLEMVNAYCTIANDGKHHEPVLVTKILDSEGNQIYEGPSDMPRTLPYKTAYLMQKLLINGVKNGTSRSLSAYIPVNVTDVIDCGGKTGTSNNSADGWFVAVTPNLVCGAWVGGEYRQIHFKSTSLGQGARTALPICGNFLFSTLLNKDFAKYRGKFEIPAGEDISLSDDMFVCDRHIVVAPSPARQEDSIPTWDMGSRETVIPELEETESPYPPSSESDNYDVEFN